MKDVFERYPLPWVHATEVGQIGDVRSSAETKDTVLQVQQVGKNGTAANAARDALAAEIVHRVNTYSDLYEALQNTMSVLRRFRDERPGEYDALFAKKGEPSGDFCRMWDQNKDALKKAEERL